MQSLPLSYRSRFEALRQEAETGPYGMSLRAVLRERPVTNSPRVEFELSLYCNSTIVSRKIGIALPEEREDKLNDLLGESVRQICLHGFYLLARQARELEDDYGTSTATAAFMTPDRLGTGRVLGEISGESF